MPSTSLTLLRSYRWLTQPLRDADSHFFLVKDTEAELVRAAAPAIATAVAEASATLWGKCHASVTTTATVGRPITTKLPVGSLPVHKSDPIKVVIPKHPIKKHPVKKAVKTIKPRGKKARRGPKKGGKKGGKRGGRRVAKKHGPKRGKILRRFSRSKAFRVAIKRSHRRKN